MLTLIPYSLHTHTTPKGHKLGYGIATFLNLVSASNEP